MALINKDYNLFTALNLPGKSFQDIDQIRKLNYQINSTQTKQFKHPIYGCGQADLKSHLQFIKQINYFIEIKQKQEGWEQMENQGTDPILLESQNQVNESLKYLQNFILEQTKQYYDKLQPFLDQIYSCGLILGSKQDEILNSDMSSLQSLIQHLFTKIQSCSNLEAKIRINLILKEAWKNQSKTLLVPIQDNIFQQTINPIVPYFSKFHNNEERVLLINFGKETYINLRAVASKTQMMYISFFSQQNVDSKYCQTQNLKQNEIKIDFNPSYARFISYQFIQSEKYLLKNERPNYKNMLLFPLDLFVPSDFEDQNKGKRKDYQQFGVSSDIHYLFRNICVNRIKKYKPTKIIVYIDGTTILDPYHFADIMKSLSESCQNNIILCCPQSKFDINTKQNIKNKDFFSEYMNYQTKIEDILRMKDYLTAFINVTSKQYYPMHINITSPSQLYRNKIRYDYIQNHINVFPFMKKIMQKLLPSKQQMSVYTKLIQQCDNQINQKKGSIPYYSLINQLQIVQKHAPVHNNYKYYLSKNAVLYDILKSQKIFQHKFILKLGKQKNRQQILNSVKSLKFYLYKQNTTSYKSISLENYSEIFVIQKNNKMIVTIFNYFDQTSNNHLILRGVAALNQKSVFLHRVKEKRLSENESKNNSMTKITSCPSESDYIFCGYNNTSNTIDKPYIYYTWPLKINVKQYFCAMIKGEIYRPQISDHIVKLQSENNLYQCCVYTRNQQLMRKDKKYSNILLYGAMFIRKPQQLQKQTNQFKLDEELKACGGYCFDGNQHNLLKIKLLDNSQQFKYYSYIVEQQKSYQSPNINFPPLLNINPIIQLVGKDRRSQFTLYGGKSPLFRTYKAKNIIYVPQKLKLIFSEEQSKINSSIVQHVYQSGFFNTIQTYPNNKIIQQYFNQSRRLRYIFSVHSITLYFDQKQDEQQFQERLFYQVQKFQFDQQMDDDQISLQLQGQKLYIELLFHSPLSKNQPYYMSIDYRNIIQNDNVKVHRQGYYIQARVSDQRFSYGPLQCIIDFVGNLGPVIYTQGVSSIKMHPISIEFVCKNKQFRPLFSGIQKKTIMQ